MSTPSTPSTPSAPSATAGPSAVGAPITPKVLTRGLEVPWGLAFLPDGSALVSERIKGTIRRVQPDGSSQVIATVPGVRPQGEGGLLGLAVSPYYATDRWVYAYFTAADDNRLVRFRLTDAAHPQVLLTGVPKGSIHNGGRLAFGPDGMLYIGAGETGDRGLAQDKGSLAGKVLRVTPEGKVPAGNPYGTAVWSIGHRNPQGLAWDPQGRMYDVEFGQDTFDEVNLIRPGANYGWPVVEGKDTGGGRFVAPLVIWPTDDASPSAGAYVDGALYVAALRGERLYRVPLVEGRAGTPTARYEGVYGRLRTVAVEPGGKALWLMTSNCDGRGSCPASGDEIVRVPVS